jgi:DNA processing protein
VRRETTTTAVRTTDDSAALHAWIALRMIPGVGVALYHALLRAFGSPTAVLAADERALRAAGASPQAARAIAAGAADEAAACDLAAARAAGVRIITWADADYPSLLREIHDPPPYLYLRGVLEPGDRRAVAVVGSRAASPYGREAAGFLAHDLAAAGVTVVSGLAHGIDGAAHRGALAAGGRTIAVLGCGVDVAYPPQHADLAGEIARHGALVSELFLGTPPRPAHFPLRNRIISGLALGTLVVEATERSGSLITARLALEQGREVFAVPGSITAPRSRGTHALLRQGAKLVTAAGDVLEEIGLTSGTSATRAAPAATCAAAPTAAGAHARVLAALGDEIADVDTLVSRTGLTPQDVLAILLELELSGSVHQYPGVSFGVRRDLAGVEAE